ncbi:MAG: ExbD/TolR family protein [Nitrospinaceae bacterium]
MIAFKRPQREGFRLDITPLINVVFLLLIFFMLSSSTVNQGLNVDLPEASSADRIASQEITLTVGQEGRLMLENEAVVLEELTAAVKQRLGSQDNPTLIIQADKDIKFDLFGQVLEKTRAAGVTVFLIATNKPEPGNPNSES